MTLLRDKVSDHCSITRGALAAARSVTGSLDPDKAWDTACPARALLVSHFPLAAPFQKDVMKRLFCC
jgi:hypothetical protein